MIYFRIFEVLNFKSQIFRFKSENLRRYFKKRGRQSNSLDSPQLNEIFLHKREMSSNSLQESDFMQSSQFFSARENLRENFCIFLFFQTIKITNSHQRPSITGPIKLEISNNEKFDIHQLSLSYQKRDIKRCFGKGISCKKLIKFN